MTGPEAHLLLYRGDTFIVSSSTQKMITFNRNGGGTFVNSESIGKSAEPQSSRHLLRQTRPMFQELCFPSQDSNLSMTDLFKSLTIKYCVCSLAVLAFLLQKIMTYLKAKMSSSSYT